MIFCCEISLAPHLESIKLAGQNYSAPILNSIINKILIAEHKRQLKRLLVRELMGAYFSVCNGNHTVRPEIDFQILLSSQFVGKVGHVTDMFGLIDQQHNLSELDQTKDVYRKIYPLN